MYYFTSPEGNKRSQSSVLDIKFTEFKLNNGLGVIITKDDTTPSVALHITYHVGSKDESDGEKGYAHLLEHLMFEGSYNLKAGEYDKLIAERGCENNAYTTEDKSVYYILLPSNQLEFAIWLESCRMTSLCVSKEALETQKEVILEEKKQILDNRPYGSVNTKLPEKLFKKGGYATEIIGLEKDIKDATLNKINQFYNNFYKPSNAFLTVSGDLDIDNTAKMIEKYFGEIPQKGKTNKPLFESEALTEEINETVYDNIQLPGLFISYRVPGENTPEFYAFDMLNNILSNGESSLLHKRLVYDKPLCLEAGSWYEPKECAGVFTIYAILMPKVEIEDVKNEIDLILDEISKGKVNKTAFQKAKNQIETRNIFRIQTNFYKAELLSHYRIFYGDAGIVNKIKDKYSSLDETSIINTAAKYLSSRQRVIFNYIPKNH